MNKRSVKRLFSTLIAVIMLVSSVPLMVSATATTATKISGIGELVSGQYVIATVKDNILLKNLDGTWVKSANATFNGNQVSGFADAVWTLTVNGSSVKIVDANGKAIAPKSGNTNGIQNKDYEWVASATGDVFKISGAGTDTTGLAYNVQNDGFRSYKISTLTGNNASQYLSEFYLYKLDEAVSGDTTAPETDAETTAPETDAETTIPETDAETTIPETESSAGSNKPANAVVSSPEAGKAYKAYLKQAKNGKVLYLDGGVTDNGRYLTMTEDASKAIEISAEKVEGGYKFYAEINGAKKYIGISKNDEGKTAVVYADATDSVFAYNAETFAWETEFEGTAYYLGTYSTYDTVSASKASYINAGNTRVEQFPLELVDPSTPVTGDVAVIAITVIATVSLISIAIISKKKYNA